MKGTFIEKWFKNCVTCFIRILLSLIIISTIFTNISSKLGNRVLASGLSDSNDSWMAMYLKDNTKLGEVSIPGTHDSAAYQMNGLSVFATPWAKTQDWNITDQLNVGIRYLDLRVYDDMSMHHGIAWVGENLEYHLNEICQFLDFHPQDFIFIRIRAEQDDSNSATFKNNFEKIISANNMQHYFAKNVNNETQVGQVRGKIILIDNTNAQLNESSINWNSIPRQDIFEPRNANQKWNLILQAIKLKNNNYYSDKLFINHISFTNKVRCLRFLANDMNQKLSGYLRNDFFDGKMDIKNVGIVAMDFPSKTLINQIIVRNVSDSLS